MRISPGLIRKSYKIDRLLPPLLVPNKSIEQAKLELKWIKNELPEARWKDAVRRRMQYEPLQYILGTQPFGPIDIMVNPGVLIPRWETEEWTTKLGSMITKEKYKDCKILDVCTGSGCIPILLYKLLSEKGINPIIDAFDISPAAIALANKNATLYNAPINIFRQNLFQLDKIGNYDIIVSNPPYITSEEFDNGTVEKSVVDFEPKLALLGDLEFYQGLIEKVVIPSNCSTFIFELGYVGQVEIVKKLLNDWNIGTMHDSRGNLRCVVGCKDKDNEIMKLCD